MKMRHQSLKDLHRGLCEWGEIDEYEWGECLLWIGSENCPLGLGISVREYNIKQGSTHWEYVGIVEEDIAEGRNGESWGAKERCGSDQEIEFSGGHGAIMVSQFSLGLGKSIWAGPVCHFYVNRLGLPAARCHFPDSYSKIQPHTHLQTMPVNLRAVHLKIEEI